MKRYFPLLLVLLLTTCATMISARRLDKDLLNQTLHSTSWDPLFPEVFLKVLDLASYPLRVYIVKIDNPETKQWYITSPDSGEPWIQAKTVREFAQGLELDLAINASYYQKRIQDDRVRPLGLWVVNHKVINSPHSMFSAFGQDKSGKLWIRDPNDDFSDLQWAVGGGVRLLRNSVITTSDHNIHPRTALGYSSDSKQLFITVIDGRQEHSRGIGLVDLAELFLILGASEAINLDGGGSTTLAVRRLNGLVEIINSPWDHRLYGGERRVASHLGFKVNSNR